MTTFLCHSEQHAHLVTCGTPFIPPLPIGDTQIRGPVCSQHKGPGYVRLVLACNKGEAHEMHAVPSWFLPDAETLVYLATTPASLMRVTGNLLETTYAQLHGSSMPSATALIERLGGLGCKGRVSIEPGDEPVTVPTLFKAAMMVMKQRSSSAVGLLQSTRVVGGVACVLPVQWKTPVPALMRAVPLCATTAAQPGPTAANASTTTDRITSVVVASTGVYARLTPPPRTLLILTDADTRVTAIVVVSEDSTSIIGAVPADPAACFAAADSGLGSVVLVGPSLAIGVHEGGTVRLTDSVRDWTVHGDSMCQMLVMAFQSRAPSYADMTARSLHDGEKVVWSYQHRMWSTATCQVVACATIAYSVTATLLSTEAPYEQTGELRATAYTHPLISAGDFVAISVTLPNCDSVKIVIVQSNDGMTAFATTIGNLASTALVVVYADGSHAHLASSKTGVFMHVSGHLRPVNPGTDHIYACALEGACERVTLCEHELEARCSRHPVPPDTPIVFTPIGFVPQCSEIMCACGVEIA